MVQVRDNGKVCRLVVPPGALRLRNRCIGKSQQFSHRVQTLEGTPFRAATFGAIMAMKRLKIPTFLTLMNTKSRQITVNHASFFRIIARTEDRSPPMKSPLPFEPSSLRGKTPLAAPMVASP
jgi:hypothetical protein